jgi:FkbM family methyltransferase
VKNTFTRIRAFGRRFPLLKRVVSPMWGPITHGCWIIRNFLTNGRPIRIPAGDQVMLMYPEGQIAEVLWVAEFEADERNFVTRIARPGMLVVNIGANTGLYAIMTAKLVGQGGAVHAFEPSAATYARLVRNVELNNQQNVLTNNIALSDAKGRLVLRSDPRNPALDGHRFIESTMDLTSITPTDELIHCDTLDGYFERIDASGLPVVDLLILDVEGAELAVLKGGLRTLRASPRVLIVLECSQNRPQVGDLLAAERFRFYVWDAAVSRLEPVVFTDAAAIGTVIAYRGGPEEADSLAQTPARSGRREEGSISGVGGL